MNVFLKFQWSIHIESLMKEIGTTERLKGQKDLNYIDMKFKGKSKGTRKIK